MRLQGIFLLIRSKIEDIPTTIIIMAKLTPHSVAINATSKAILDRLATTNGKTRSGLAQYLIDHHEQYANEIEDDKSEKIIVSFCFSDKQWQTLTVAAKAYGMSRSEYFRLLIINYGKEQE